MLDLTPDITTILLRLDHRYPPYHPAPEDKETLRTWPSPPAQGINQHSIQSGKRYYPQTFENIFWLQFCKLFVQENVLDVQRIYLQVGGMHGHYHNTPPQKTLNYFYHMRFFMCHAITHKLDGVGSVDNRPSPDQLHHFVQKQKTKQKI